jgi:hypothetical protein
MYRNEYRRQRLTVRGIAFVYLLFDPVEVSQRVQRGQTRNDHQREQAAESQEQYSSQLFRSLLRFQIVFGRRSHVHQMGKSNVLA